MDHVSERRSLFWRSSERKPTAINLQQKQLGRLSSSSLFSTNFVAFLIHHQYTRGLQKEENFVLYPFLSSQSWLSVLD